MLGRSYGECFVCGYSNPEKTFKMLKIRMYKTYQRDSLLA